MVKIPNELRQSLSTNRNFSDIQSTTYEDMQLYNTSCKLYLITRFSLRPPELMKKFDIVCKYYRCFNVSSKPLKDNVLIELLDEHIKKCAWIDAMKLQVLIQNKALH